MSLRIEYLKQLIETQSPTLIYMNDGLTFYQCIIHEVTDTEIRFTSLFVDTDCSRFVELIFDVSKIAGIGISVASAPTTTPPDDLEDALYEDD